MKVGDAVKFVKDYDGIPADTLGDVMGDKGRQKVFLINIPGVPRVVEITEAVAQTTLEVVTAPAP